MVVAEAQAGGDWHCNRSSGRLGLTQFIRSFLFGVSPSDPLTFAGISLFLPRGHAGQLCSGPAAQ